MMPTPNPVQPQQTMAAPQEVALVHPEQLESPVALDPLPPVPNVLRPLPPKAQMPQAAVEPLQQQFQSQPQLEVTAPPLPEASTSEKSKEKQLQEQVQQLQQQLQQ